jgi:scyllo-inositol 2-dehydrogenase (NADP+)
MMGHGDTGQRSVVAENPPNRDADMIKTVVVGHGLAGRAFHCPLIRRQRGLYLHGIVARDPEIRSQAVSLWGPGVHGYADLDQALTDPEVQLVVIATPHDSHADLAIRALENGRHCVVDKVMALTTADADRMIAARDRSGCMLSVFHNRRWDWDYLTVREALNQGIFGRPLLIESSVCRHAPPRSWRGHVQSAGTILHDWGAHLVDQALQLGLGPCRRLTAWLTPAPWSNVDSGAHGRIVLEFDDTFFQIESSRICRLDRPRWWIIGSEAGFVKFGIDPQEDALRAGDIDHAAEPPEFEAIVRRADGAGQTRETRFPTVRGHWDAYYRNIALHVEGDSALAVTAEHAREVVRLLEAATRSAREHMTVTGPWGQNSNVTIVANQAADG